MFNSVHTSRFAIVAALIGLSLLVLYPPGETLKEGIDLQGGYSLIYELDLSQNPGGNARQLTADTITQLRQRVDPTGQRNLVWRQLGANRLEVQMPLPSPEVIERRRQYDQAVQQLSARNLDLNRVAQTLQAHRELDAQTLTRAQAVVKLANGDPRRTALLTQLSAAYDRYAQARDAADAVAAGAATQSASTQPADAPAAPTDRAAIAAVASAQAELNDLYSQLEATNVSIARMTRLFERIAAGGKTAALANEELSAAKAEFPAAAAELDNALAAHNAWFKVKGTLDDVEDLKRILRGAGVLEFRILPMRGDPDRYVDATYWISRLEQAGGATTPTPGDEFAWFEIDDPAQFRGDVYRHTIGDKEYVLAYNTPERTLLETENWKLTQAFISSSDNGGMAVSFTLNTAGARQFRALTGANIHKPLSIMLDNRAISAPNLQSEIAGQGQITGDFTRAEIDYLVNTLNAGTLKARLKETPIAERTVGASLGEHNRTAGIRAIVSGFLLTLAFMGVVYLWAGAVANFALVLNLLFILALMAQFGATFTLPGMAGLVLTLAMAIDANVLINERIREEQEKGADGRRAVAEGYNRAFWTIFDSNLTTVLTAGVLYYFGNEDIRSFAVTLFLGILVSMFTALWVTRALFDYLLARRTLDEIKMVKLIGVGNVDWIKQQRIFRPISAVVIASSLALFLYMAFDPTQRSKVFDIEFLGGTSVQVDFKPGQELGAEEVRDRMAHVADSLNRDWATTFQQATVVPIFDAAAALELQLPDTTMPASLAADLLEAAMPGVFLENGVTPMGNTRTLRLALAPPAIDVPQLQNRLRDLAAELRLASREIGESNIQAIGEERKSFEIITTYTNRELIVALVTNAFSKELDVQRGLEFQVVRDADGAVGAGFPITDDLLSEVIDRGPTTPVRQYYNGAAIVLEDLQPPQSASALRERLRTARLAGSDVTTTWRDFDVIGLDAAPGSNAADENALFTDVAVVVHDPQFAYSDENDTRWTAMVNEEVNVIEAALRRDKPLSKVTQFDAQIADTATRQGIVAIVLGFISVSLYIWLRFGTVGFAAGALASVVHDVIVAVGVVSLLAFFEVPGMRINLVVVGAFLTVIGYSINDTIVVFDRIREKRGKATTPVTGEMINDAINQTLARTILTSTTTMLTLLVMLMFGGDGLRGFAMALLIGVITGTYSSIAIAAPLILAFPQETGKKRRRPKAVPA